MNALNKIVNNYIRFVFAWDEDENGENWKNKTNDPKFDEYLEEEFKFSSVNNYHNGFDIVSWYMGIDDYDKNGHYGCDHQGDINNIIDFKTACEVLTIINNYMAEFDITFTDYDPYDIIRQYAYVYANSMSLDDLKKILLQE